MSADTLQHKTAAESQRPCVIFLVGFMGSGKSTIGPALGNRLGWPFVDLDTEIERRECRSIPDLFEMYGEDGFRDREHAALREQAELGLAGHPRVLALGGGTFAFARNRDPLRRAGLSIWLDADAGTLWNRVRHESHRPLARNRETFLRLFALRRPSYAHAEFRVDAGVHPDEVLRQIIELGWMQRLLDDA